MISFFLLLWPALATKQISKHIKNIIIGSLVKGINVIKPMIWVIKRETLITYIVQRGEVGFLPEKYLKIK